MRQRRTPGQYIRCRLLTEGVSSQICDEYPNQRSFPRSVSFRTIIEWQPKVWENFSRPVVAGRLHTHLLTILLFAFASKTDVKRTDGSPSENYISNCNQTASAFASVERLTTVRTSRTLSSSKDLVTLPGLVPNRCPFEASSSPISFW